MNKINTYTSTGWKLLSHPEVTKKIIDSKKGTPVSLQIAPTSKCNLSCSFCSNRNREKHEELSLSTVMNVINQLRWFGLKAIEISGGGDPTCWNSLNALVLEVSKMGIEIGLITNGIKLKEVLSPQALELLKWVRISMNCLDYVDDIELPEIKGTLGFSYVINDNTQAIIWERLKAYAEKYKPKYIRIVPNCQATEEQQIQNNIKYSQFVKALGTPFFYQEKNFIKPKNCWWGYFKPFLLHDGWIYPCSSVVLNEDSDATFHEKYRWVHSDSLSLKYITQMQSIPNESCTHCVFNSQNNMVDSLINPSGMENFI